MKILRLCYQRRPTTVSAYRRWLLPSSRRCDILIGIAQSPEPEAVLTKPLGRRRDWATLALVLLLGLPSAVLVLSGSHTHPLASPHLRSGNTVRGFPAVLGG